MAGVRPINDWAAAFTATKSETVTNTAGTKLKVITKVSVEQHPDFTGHVEIDPGAIVAASAESHINLAGEGRRDCRGVRRGDSSGACSIGSYVCARRSTCVDQRAGPDRRIQHSRSTGRTAG